MRAFQIVDGIAGGREDKKSDDRAKHDLIGDAADLGVVVERNPRGERPRRKVNRHLPLVGLATPPDGVARRTAGAARGRRRCGFRYRSADRRRVKDTAFVPQLVQTAVDLEW